MNKIKSIISYAVFFLGLVFVACQDVDPYGEGIANSLQLSVGQSDVSFDMERSSSVSVNASDNFGWSASTSATWVRLSPSSGVGVGNINIGVEDNPSTEKRNAIVTLKSSRYNKTASFNVEQAGTYLRIDTTSIGYFPLSGDKRSVAVVSNAAWEISSCPSWITTSAKSGNAGNTSFDMEVKENKDLSRDGVIVIKNAALSYRINVTQGGVQLDLGKQTMSFTNAKGSDTFTIKSNSSWTVTSDKPSWCTVDQSSGSNNATIKVSVTANTTESSRDAIITVKAGNVSRQVKVTQAALQLKLSKETLSFTPNSGNNTFTITSNVSWTVTSNKTSWCTVDKSSGSNNATIKVSVTENTSDASRNAIITVKSGDVTKQVKVTQEGKQLKLSKDALSFTPSSGNNTFTITSNMSWTVSSNKTWCTVDKSSGSNNATIKVSVTDNTSESSREAIITVKSGDLSKQVKVTQDGVTLTVSESSLSFTSSAGNKTFTITSNYASWTVSSNQTSWCTVDKTSGSAASATIKVSVTANTSANSRSATITVKSGNAKKTVSVSQSGDQSFNASMGTTNYKADGDYQYLNVTASSGISWTASASQSWVHFTASKYNTYNGTGSASNIRVYVDANPTLSKRSAVVYVKSGSVTKSINITQDAGTLTASMNTKSYKAEGDNWPLDVTASSGISWTASASMSWVHFTVSKYNTYSGTGSVSNIRVYVDANPNTYSRTATVYVKSGSTTKSITITQEGKPKAPFVINSVTVGNVAYDGTIINNYGSTIYSSQTRYLKPKLFITVNTSGTYTVYTKLYTPNGSLSTGTSSPTGYTFSNSKTLYSTTTEWILSGWGGNTSGHWSAGQYRWEFWYNGEKIGEKSFTVY